jgi:hypothetical protein
MVNKFFLTFGGPTDNYHSAVNRICQQARDMEFFDHVIGYTEQFLQDSPKFWNKHREFLSNNKRGYGFWLWKPYVIKQTLKRMKRGDILFYVDAGCVFNKDGIDQLHRLTNLVTESPHGILGFQMRHQEKYWTKSDCATALDAVAQMQGGQLHATVIVLRKCKHVTRLAKLWYNYCSDNYHLIDDSPSNVNNRELVEHRHDQSIFSLLRKKYGATIIPDEILPENEVRDRHNHAIFANRQRY